MSKVQIEIPDDRWFRGEWQTRPQDKQLCAVIEKESLFNSCIRIAQYRKGNDNFRYVLSHMIEKYGIGQINMNYVDRWKPLGLPADVEERVLAEVEKWFEEDSMENKTCETCVDNDFGLCDRLGVLVENDDSCEKHRKKTVGRYEREGDQRPEKKAMR